MTEKIIQVENLSFSYGNTNTNILKSSIFQLAKERYLVFLGLLVLAKVPLKKFFTNS